MTALVDQAARDRIRASLDESMVVEAAAGTGKTSELVARLVEVFAEGRGTAQTVVAVTFTEKAAGELKLRLRAELEKARQSAGQGSSRRLRLDEAVARLEEARVSTIHGFCNDLLHERPVEGLVDPRFQVLAEPEAEALYRRAFDRWVEGQLERPPEGLRRALRRRAAFDDGDPVERIRRAGWTLAEWRDFRAPWRREAFAREASIDRLIERLHAFADLMKTCINPADGFYADTWLARRISADVRVSEPLMARDHDQLERDHDQLEAALVDLARHRQWRRPRKPNDRNYRGATRDAVMAAHAALCDDLDDFARRADADLAALLQQELFATVDEYEALKARAGSLDFLDLLVRTRDLVRDRADVREDLQRRFSHIFVDEFQDTDPLQAEILLLLSSADAAVARWRDVTPARGKLFVVGDPKQSIYRFRRADVGIYQEVKRLLHERGAAVLDLTSSFRAVPSVQRFLNVAFAPRLVEDHATLQAGYVPLAPYRAERPGQPSVVALPVPSPYGRWGLTKTAIDASLPDATAAFVRWLLEESGWRVTERDKPGEELSVAARHVCLLFRRFTQWGADITQPYVEALEARGIAHMLVGGKSFRLREEVETLRTALTAIEWPDDELAVYGTLRGPLFAVGDEALLEYRERLGRLHPFRVREPAAGEALTAHLAAVVDGLKLLGDLHRRRNYRPVEDTVAALLTATRAHAAFILRPSGERALANVFRIAELARTFEASGGVSFRGFVEQLAEEGAGETAEAPVVEEGSEGVRIMTVHRAKGLEFPVVILADITANLAAQNPGRHIDSERGLCAVRLAGWSPWDLLDHEDEEMARDRAEGVRIAYVAATRARDLLVVPAVGDDPFANGWAAAPDGWVEPVQRAVYPPAPVRRSPQPAPSCPPFGEDSVVDRPDRDMPGRDNVQPGLHLLGLASESQHPSAGYPVVWWDPRALTLGVRPPVGIPRQDLIEDPGADVLDVDRLRYAEWQRGRQAALEQGARASVVVKTVTEWAQQAGDDDGSVEPAVTVVDAASGIVRPSGPRFGTLVHAVLATVALDASRDAVAEVATMQARILGATSEEMAAAVSLAEAALAHPLLVRAREAWRVDRCRRESPITAVLPDGSMLEGVLDLAFEEDAGWTVVDFKTQAELTGPLARHRRQVSAYAAMVARVTGRPATPVLMRL
ncbi:MAG TPA: UvrD-helicase domain-containing protein [Candidatus Methylomirabilis sp.]|nr:UvrD-helicase domain-containing protein [Candidatus Methylomirabilis sp.]